MHPVTTSSVMSPPLPSTQSSVTLPGNQSLPCAWAGHWQHRNDAILHLPTSPPLFSSHKKDICNNSPQRAAGQARDRARNLRLVSMFWAPEDVANSESSHWIFHSRLLTEMRGLPAAQQHHGLSWRRSLSIHPHFCFKSRFYSGEILL